MKARTFDEMLPDFSAELDAIKKKGISIDLINKIITKHAANSEYNRKLYDRYKTVLSGIPIFNRTPRYEEEENPINNRVNNDFFSEIVDFKVGYFAGEPISYSYSDTQEAVEVTGGEEKTEKVKKCLTDFTTRNNMFGVDMETTKNASIYGYSGRLFYIDKDGAERVMPIHGFETIILSSTDISEPEYAIRYYRVKDINQHESYVVEFYDDRDIYIYRGTLNALKFEMRKEHCFDFCPLQGIANNKECLGDAEKVINLIDDYDKIVSDNSNEIEAFVHAMMIVQMNADEDVIKKAQKSGALIVPPVGSNPVQEPVKWITKNINDAFTENHLKRLEDNIYRFSRTPNMNDAVFSSASGVALKFRLHGLETKCATFEANVMNASQYMWKVLCSSWAKKGIIADPLQFCMEFSRNFPLDRLSEAQTAQAFIAAGLPKRWVFSQISGVDDIDYILQLIEEEKGDITPLFDDNDDNADDDNGGNLKNDKIDDNNVVPDDEGQIDEE